jgi:hypothetical protein
MTRDEQNSINQLVKVVENIRQENANFKNDISKLVETINSKTDKKHVPIHLEQDILSTAQSAINKAIGECLGGYNSPLNKLIISVVAENEKELRAIISDSFTQVIRTEEFKKSIVSALSHKVAKTIISNNDGLFDKVSNELKADAVFKSKMVVAVSNVVNECLNTNK